MIVIYNTQDTRLFAAEFHTRAACELAAGALRRHGCGGFMEAFCVPKGAR
jgi:hypothetical protein